MINPPTLPDRKPATRLIWFIILGALGLCVVCAAGVFFVGRSMWKEPEPRKGFGNPTVAQQLQEPWAKYRLAEVPMSIELPAAPEKNSLVFHESEGILYESWISYVISSDYATATLSGFWYRSREWVELKPDLEEVQAEIASSYPDFKGSIQERQAGQLRGYELGGDYTEDGERWRVRVFIFAKAKAEFLLRSDYYLTDAKEAEAEYERMVASIQLE